VLKLSIIIPVYNGATTIEELVKQLFDSLAGTYELEVLLVNDCSPDDNSADVCRDLAAKQKDLVFLDLARVEIWPLGAGPRSIGVRR
jgi:glycosyltransferase involved in cell wall biosynthesis